MTTLITCNAVSKHYGTRELFERLSISFEDDQRVGFLGPNGAGKSTFLKLLAGLEQPDDGEISRRRDTRIGFLPQEDTFPAGATVATVLDLALADRSLEPYERDAKVGVVVAKFGFTNLDKPVELLSGGWRKRLALAREIIQEPDLLLMDEPTNHLDLSGIQWLEELLLGVAFGFVAVSHDRYFLERVTTRVVELNPLYESGYFSVNGSYSSFIEKRAEFLEAQRAQQVTLSNIVRRESAFLKSQAKARRTKSKARIDEAYRLKDELRSLKQRTAQTVSAGIDFDATGRRSKKLVAAKGISKSLGGKLLFEDVSLLLSPGTRLGLLGANGSGKTTLIRVLTGDLLPDSGVVERADNLRVVVFDQKREALPQDITLRQALAGRDDSITFRGQNIHISAWAKRFLFGTDQLEMPVGELSGGEQARILIARLMLQPADLLVLDEPTNDLDIHSLDVLEESLREFGGAIVLVTHDRFMLDSVCTEIIGLLGGGRVGKYADSADWQSTSVQSTKPETKTKAKKPRDKRGGLTASEQKELQTMEDTIHDADAQVEACRIAAEDPAVGSDHIETQKRWEALEEAKKHVELLYARWEELEAKKS